MRVLHLNARADCGGAEVMILDFLQRSRERGDTTAVAMSPGPWENRYREYGRFYELPLVERSVARLPRFVWRLRRIIKDFQPDVIHAHNPTMMLGATLATWGMRRRPGMIGTLHGNGGDDYGKEAKIVKLFPGAVTVVTPFIQENLQSHGIRANSDPAAGRLLMTITNGVAPSPEPVSKGELHEKYGIEPGRPIVIAVGRLVDFKRMHLAIETIALLPEADLIIFGEGPERAHCEEIVKELGIGDRVHLPGTVNDVRRWTGAADAALVTSQGEGLSLALVELLDAGIPVIAGDVPGVSDVIDNVCAFITDVENPEKTAGVVRTVLAGGPEVEAKRAAGRRRAQEFSGEAMVDKYFELYEGAVRK